MSLRLDTAKRNYELEDLKNHLKFKPVTQNPLRQLADESYGMAGQKGMFQIDTQPVAKAAQVQEEDEDKGGIAEKAKAFDPLAEFTDMDTAALDFESWEAKKITIFALFSSQTDDQDVMVDERKDRNVDRPIRMGQGKSRMEQLNIKPGQTSNTPTGTTYSAKEFTSQLERLNKELNRFWDKDDKVACIRIAIQCAKLLNDVASPMFYPQKFILLTDILDTFGELVHQRMIKLTKIHSNNRIIITDENEETLDFTQIPDKVSETCRNWFLKCACIREVLPRIYLELALVSSHKYMQMRVQQSDLVRLSKMVRGIAEPLCAAYTCAYLARVGHAMDPKSKDYLYILTEFMFKLYSSIVVKGHPTLEMEKYLSLFEPTIDWLIQCLAWQADRNVFKDVWALYTGNNKHAQFLKAIIRYFPAEIISVAVTIITLSIKNDYAAKVDDQLMLIKELGLCLLRSPPKKNNVKLEFINFGWDTMGKTKNADRYMDCSIVLIEFSIKSLNQASVQTFIREIFKRFQDFALSMSANDTLFRKLEFLLVKVMMTSGDFSELIGLENLLGLLNYFPQTMKQKLCQKMLTFFCEQKSKLDDGFLIHSIFQVAKTLHDKINFMSQESEIQEVSTIICRILKRIDHGKDLDKTLNVYTSARGLFINLDKVTEALINSTLKLGIRCHTLVKGQHTQKTVTFVKACIAFAHITIPTIESYLTQVHLFQMAAQVALLNGLIGETDSLLKGVLATISDNFKDTPEDLERVTQTVLQMLGFLVVVPSNPEDQYFQIVEGIIQLMKIHKWNSDKSHILRCRIYAAICSYLCSQIQDKLPYRIPFVNSNDQIFIGNEDFVKEANSLMDYCFKEILDVITSLNEIKKDHLVDLFNICLLSSNVLIGHANYGTKQITMFTNKMFKMADMYLTEFNATLPPNSPLMISRNYLNRSFALYQKKKAAAAK